MSENGSSTCGCKALFPLNLLALSFLLVLIFIQQEAKRTQDSIAPGPALIIQQLKSLDQQLTQTALQAKQVVGLRQHYYGLFTDLTVLAKTDPAAADIVKKFGIQYQPPEETAAPANR